MLFRSHHHHLQVHFQLLEVEELVQDVDHHLGYLRVRFRISGFDNKCDTVQDAPSWLRTPFKTDPLSIPQLAKLTCAANSLSRQEFVVSICFSASQRLDQHQGSFTTLMCFDLVMDEKSPFGVPNARTRRR